MDKAVFRYADENDCGLILSFIRKLAEYEKMSDEVVATRELLKEWIFDKKKAEVIFVMADGTEVGFALFFHNFSTFLGRAGIYLEDLFVLPEYRGKGYGKALFKKLAQIAVERGCGRLDWWCLDWNQPSIDFYLSMGAVPMDEWTVYRIAGETLQKLGGENSVQTEAALQKAVNENAARTEAALQKSESKNVARIKEALQRSDGNNAAGQVPS